MRNGKELEFKDLVKPKIMGIFETKLNKDEKSPVVFPEGYSMMLMVLEL